MVRTDAIAAQDSAPYLWYGFRLTQKINYRTLSFS